MKVKTKTHTRAHLALPQFRSEAAATPAGLEDDFRKQNQQGFYVKIGVDDYDFTFLTLVSV